MSYTVGYVPPPPPPMGPPARIAALKELAAILDLAKTDEGMKDLLDRAREYYLLKRPND